MDSWYLADHDDHKITFLDSKVLKSDIILGILSSKDELLLSNFKAFFSIKFLFNVDDLLRRKIRERGRGIVLYQ